MNVKLNLRLKNNLYRSLSNIFVTKALFLSILEKSLKNLYLLFESSFKTYFLTLFPHPNFYNSSFYKNQ